MAAKDLDVEQLAVYLHLTPPQVRRLADREQLPGRRIGGQWRFSEAEVHTWLEDRIGASNLEELAQMQPMVDRWSDANSDSVELSGLLHAAAIAIPLEARTRGSVIRTICKLAEATGLLWDASKMSEAVLREKTCIPLLSTTVSPSCTRAPQSSILAEPLLALGVTSQPLPFGNQSGHLTDVFFLICSTDDRVHLQVLAKISRLLSGTNFLNELRSCTSAERAHELVVRFESELDIVS